MKADILSGIDRRKKNRLHQGRMTGNGSALIALFVICAFLVLVLGARQYYRFSTAPAWVASGDLQAGQIITADHIKQTRSGDDGGIANPRALLGRLLDVDKRKGDVFRAGELSTPPRDWLAAKVPPGRVLYTLVPASTAIPHTQIRNGDRLDVLARGQYGVRMVASDVLLVGVMQPKQPSKSTPQGRSLLASLTSLPAAGQADAEKTALVLAVLPEHVYPLASIGGGQEVTLVMHGAKEVRGGKMLAINPTHRQVEVVNGLNRQRAMVRR